MVFGMYVWRLSFKMCMFTVSKALFLSRASVICACRGCNLIEFPGYCVVDVVQ